MRFTARPAPAPSAPVIAAPSSSGVTVAGSAVATRRPRRITAMESDSPISSSRSALIRRTASPAARALRSSSQIPAWAPTSTPRVGCDAISSTGSPESSRPTTSFCWFPPDSAAAGTSTPGVRTSNSATMRSVSRRAAARSSRPSGPGRATGGRVWWPRMRFAHSGCVASSPCARAVFGDVPDPRLPAAERRDAGDVAAVEHDPARGGVPHPHDRLDQLRLAVALDPGDAQHLARVHDEVHVRQQGAAGLPGEREALDAQHLPVRDRGLPRARVRQLAAHHHLGQLAAGDGARVRGADARAAADHRDAVRDRAHLVQLVGDEQERVALGLHAPQGGEQLVHLLRDQDGRGLVQDHRAGAPVEHLEDLHALPVRHAEALQQHLRLGAQAHDPGQLGDPGAGPGADAVRRLGAEQHVLRDREVVREHEVLVHHADPGADRVGGRAERHLRTVDPDHPLVRLLHAVEDLHQGRLAGPVLPAQRMHLAAAHPQVDVVVRDDAGEPLGDPDQLDGVPAAVVHLTVVHRCRLRHASPGALVGSRAALTACWAP